MFITQAHVRTCTIDIILLNKMLEILVGVNKTTSAIAMEVKNEYSKFLSSVVKTNKEAYLEYNETEDGLDSFL